MAGGGGRAGRGRAQAGCRGTCGVGGGVFVCSRATLVSRVAMVTGASAGSGLAVAEYLLAQGARVVLNGRRADKLNAVADRLNAMGMGRAMAVAGEGNTT